MKWISKLFIVTLFTLGIFVFPARVFASDGPKDDDKIVLGGSYSLESGETLTGNLVVFGGNANLENGSTVKKNILVMGGSLAAAGKVDGGITIVGGSVEIKSSAAIKDSVIVVGGKLEREAGASIKGDIIDVTSGQMQYQLPPTPVIPAPPVLPGAPSIPKIFSRFPFPLSNYLWSLNNVVNLDPIRDLAGGVFKALALAALAALIVLIIPKPTERVAYSIVENPVLTGGLGCLTAIVLPFLILIMIFTLILIPVIPVLIIVIAFAALFGWIAMGLEIGRRMESLFRTRWEPPIAAGIGVLAITFATSVVDWIPCIGWMLPTLLIVVGLGGVIISRFGIEKISGGGQRHQDGGSVPVGPTPGGIPPVSDLLSPQSFPNPSPVVERSEITQEEKVQQPFIDNVDTGSASTDSLPEKRKRRPKKQQED